MLRLKEYELADCFWKRALGLMLRRKVSKPLLFVFPRESRSGSAIHSLLVFFEFDAVYLDSRKRVVDVVKVKPFSFFVSPKKPAMYLVEAPSGWAEKNGLRKGSRIEF